MTGDRIQKQAAEKADHRSTDRVLEILEYAALKTERSFALPEMAACLNAPKSSLYPILQTLSRRGYLKYNARDHRYSIGYKCYEVGTAYVRQGGISGDIASELRKIVAGCEESSHYAELVDGDVFYLFKEDSPQSIRMFSSPGKRLPAYSTALGKALLCERTRDELEALYPNGLYAVTDHTITSMDALVRQLEEIRRTGFASENEESTPYIRCIAVPVRSGTGICAAISVPVPVFRYTKEKEEKIKHLLLSAQQAIQARLAIL